ncbi:MAG: tetratricopeptide repeat protein [Gammaproteobacteria bacterium]|nr:tetratricopeptide repeat protein [Gammaproteobacteria bacterium]
MRLHNLSPRQFLLMAAMTSLLGACASTAPVSEPVAAATTPITAQAPKDTQGTAPAEDLLQYERAPMSTEALEADPVFKILSAEFAGQREQLAYAVTQYAALAASSRDPAVAERATRIALFGEDNAAALTAAKRWVLLAPTNLDARQLAATLHVRAGEVEPAVTHLEYFLAHDRSPDDVKLRTVASLLGREEEKATALAVMEKLIADRVSETDTLLLYAVLALRADDLESSQRAMDQLVQRADIKPAIALAYVTALQREGKREVAMDFLAKALVRTPDEFPLRLLYARFLAESSQFDQAREEFLRLDRQDPGNAEVAFALGLLGSETRRLDEAGERFGKLRDHVDYAGSARFYLGQIAEMREQPEQALSEYASVPEGDSYFQAQLRIAIVQGAAKKPDEALATLAALKPADEEQARQHVLVEAEILINNERLQEAMALLDRSLNGTFDSALLYSRAMLAERMNRLEVLEADLREIIAREPENAEALNALGYTLADRTDRLEEASGFIRQALALAPDSFYVLDSMGWVLFRMGKPEEALPYLEKARALKNDPEVVAHLGEVLWTLGRQAEARALWDSVLKENPDEPRIRKTMQRLVP